jgi:hypothetical protein
MVELLDTIDEQSSYEDLTKLGAGLKRNEYITVGLATLDRQASGPLKPIKPAELAFLSPAVPDTLQLYELKS